MHLGNGAITPECAALTYGAAAAGLAAAGASIFRGKTERDGLSREKLQLAAGLGCAVFLAQTINVPVAPGMSAHFVGGVLLASVLGPALGAWTMALVLAAQAVFLGDGGIAALGANVLNMALLPTGMVAVAKHFALLKRFRRRWLFELGTVAAFAVVLAAALIVGETAFFRPASELASWGDFAARMLGYHLWIGFIEGCATIAVALMVHFVAVARRGLTFPSLAVTLAAAVLLTTLHLPISSSLPDGYEAAAQGSGVERLLTR